MHSAAPSGSFCARRDFLKALFAAPAFLRVTFTSGFELRIGIVYDDANRDALRGARMCVTESTRAAMLLGAALSALELNVSDATVASAVTGWIAANRLSAVVVACTAQRLAQLLQPLAAAGVVVVNSTASPDQVAGLCRSDVRSVMPTRAQRGGAEVWDETVERFGGAQLNARYQAAYNAPMTSAAWCGWFAVKLLWESAARVGADEPAALLAFLGSTRAAFDGHKGDMLSFDANHVLRQPLYEVTIVNGRKEVAEVKPGLASDTTCS